MGIETSAPSLNFLLALGLTFVLMVILFGLNYATRNWVVRPLSWVLLGDRQRTIWYQIVLLPGTVIHELSHLLACLVLLVPVTEFKPFSADPKSPILGWVKHRATDPVRGGLIALAPFLGGSLALLLLSRLVLPAFYAADWFGGLPAPASGSLGALLGDVGQLMWDLLTHTDYLDWRTWLFLYLVFSIGLNIAPSAVDLQAVPAGILLIVGAVGGCYLLGLTLQLDWAALPAVADGLGFLTTVLLALNRLLAYSVVLVALPLIVLVPLAAFLARLRG